MQRTSEEKINDVLFFIDEQLKEIKNDQVVNAPIDFDMVKSPTRAIANLSVKIRLRGVKDILEHIKNIIEKEQEAKALD